MSNEQNIHLEGGTYEILRKRLEAQTTELSSKLNSLNVSRKEVFGSIETKLLSTQRVTTDNNCVPWDIFTLGDQMLFGYNVQMGLKSEISVEDVISIFKFDGKEFKRNDLALLSHPAFADDFKNLYRYYKDTQFVKFFVSQPYLFMVFKIGKGVNDVKAFKWAIEEDETLTYIDARSEHDIKYPNQHEFEWVKTNRSQHREGDHSHISIEDKVFVETIGGDLTVKIEDNTETGLGIYAEEVDILDQTLDDADIHYSVLDNLVLLKIKPYQEKKYRHLVFNEKVAQVTRIDAISESCVLLPDDQGLIFSQGYYLQNGEYKLFDNDLEDMVFERKVPAPNGEDYLYVFFNKAEGLYLLLIYNIINQEVKSPITCHGFTLLKTGQLLYFKSDEEAKKAHTIQIWQTPFVDSDLEFTQDTDSLIYKIGNRDIVKAMSECNEIINLVNKGEAYKNVYFDILKKSSDLLDNYYWLGDEETYQLNATVSEIKTTASSAIGEFDKIQNVKKDTNSQLQATVKEIEAIETETNRTKAQDLTTFVAYLAQIRKLRGQVIGLKELKYIDLKTVELNEQKVLEMYDAQSELCAKFLEKDESLEVYRTQVAQLGSRTDDVVKVVDINKIEEEIDAVSSDLEMLIDMVGNLKIEDATQTTQIIDNISTIYSSFNQIKTGIKRKRKSLQSVEASSEFNAQIKLVDQSVINYIDLCNSPEKCEEYLAKIMVQLEELEGKFSDFDEFIEKISIKRDEIYQAFENKKIVIVETRNRKSTALFQSAERILKASSNKLKTLKEPEEINTYFASDLMINKLRDVVEDLIELGDTVKADDIQSRLKSSKTDALRQLKDKNELFSDSDNAIKLGKHNFLVTTGNKELSIVYKNDKPYYYLNGTNFFEEITNPEFLQNAHLSDLLLPSESKEVYRSEYLAYSIFNKFEAENKLSELEKLTLTELQAVVVKETAVRFNEGYIKGVHDYDTSLVLAELVKIHFTAGSLFYSPLSRTVARYWWNTAITDEVKANLTHQINGASMVRKLFPDSHDYQLVIEEIKAEVLEFQVQLTDTNVASEAASFLFDEVSSGEGFVYDSRSVRLATELKTYLKDQKQWTKFEKQLNHFSADPVKAFKQCHLMAKAFNTEHPELNPEVSELLNLGIPKNITTLTADFRTTLTGLLGSHGVINNQEYEFDFYLFNTRLKDHSQNIFPAYQAFTQLKSNLVKQASEDMRLDEFKPKVMSSFVRNQLIDKVYLHLVGDNLAKQIGTAGESKRTDLMGMLLLVSPPGYGKTTLMEYVANRLGLIFMKINGPAIGHEVTSVDPSMATNSGAREELKKLNLAFEMGDNVMIYVDDIQHCNPEFLQKFISLCDAQRKIEGIYKGKPKTYDFKGKKVCVIMAGNPYTESGDKFQIPDMLANRADIYNLGDAIGDSAKEFELSFVENCLTSNATLNSIASKNIEDIHQIIQSIESGLNEGLDLKGNYSGEDIAEVTGVMKKTLLVRNIILKVNAQYIDSAGQNDQYRTEPPFKLQGSYRNMNKVVEKIVPIMNDDELETLIMSHYENECQTLTTGSEFNLLRFKELIHKLTPEESARLADIRETFVQNNKLKGYGGDGPALIASQISELSQHLSNLKGNSGSTNPQKIENNFEPNIQLSGLDKFSSSFSELLSLMQNNQAQIIQELGEQKKFDASVTKKEEEKEKKKKAESKKKAQLVKTVKKDKEAELKALRKLVEAGVSSKKTDDEANTLLFDLVFKNTSKSTVNEIHGVFLFFSKDGKEINRIAVDYKTPLESGEGTLWQSQLTIDSKDEHDLMLMTIPLEELEYEWVPTSIMN